MTTPPAFTDAEKLAEVEREIAFRHRVYRKWVAAGRMSSATAQRQIQIMNAIAADYRARAEAQGSLFT